MSATLRNWAGNLTFHAKRIHHPRTIQEIREIPGIGGVHIMAYRQEESVAEIVDRSKILQGRLPWFPGRDDAPLASQRTAS